MEARIWCQELGDFGTNCYIVACPRTEFALVIDPGVPDPWIKETLRKHHLQPVAIVLTHGHLDHIGGVDWVKSFSRAPVWIHGADAPMLTDARLNGSAYFGAEIVAHPADRLLQDGETFTVGDLTVKVLHTPGHTPGGISLYLEPAQLIAGDTLFAGSVGRTDLHGGDHAQLVRSIREKLFVLPVETLVFPGHGPTTTIGDEREYNPFV